MVPERNLTRKERISTIIPVKADRIMQCYRGKQQDTNQVVLRQWSTAPRGESEVRQIWITLKICISKLIAKKKKKKKKGGAYEITFLLSKRVRHL